MYYDTVHTVTDSATLVRVFYTCSLKQLSQTCILLTTSENAANANANRFLIYT